MLNTQTYTGQKLEPFMSPDEAVTESVPFGASLTLAKGTLVGIKTGDSKFYEYDDGNADGTEVAKAILQYDITTDGSGKVTIASDKAVTYDTAPVYVKGYFETSELTGLDANAVADLGRLVKGTTSSGTLKVN